MAWGGALICVLKQRSSDDRIDFSLPRFLLVVAISGLSVAFICLYLSGFTFPAEVLS